MGFSIDKIKTCPLYFLCDCAVFCTCCIKRNKNSLVEGQRELKVHKEICSV